MEKKTSGCCLKAAIAVLLVYSSVTQAKPRWIEGTYRNPALGFSVQVPPGFKGIAGDEAGPERGVGISLPSGGEISVFGEPNSLEYKNPSEGVRVVLAYEKCTSGRQKISQARIGKLSGARGTLVCGNRLMKLLLAFRPGGGPIYWLRLDTVRSHESEDNAILESVAASFKLIRWE